MLTFLILYSFISLFGLMVGSFLNCVIYRLEAKKNFAKGRSFCPKCKHTLAWYDLIPVLSFVLLGGKCRYCHKKISWQYPLVELATGLIFLLISNFQFPISNEFSIFQFSNLIYLFVIACLLELIFVYDLRHYIIPDRFVFSAIGLAFIFQIFGNWKLEIGNCDPLVNLFFAVLIGTGFFFCIWFFSRGRFMGFGDVKLSLFMGLFLGWPNILLALFFAFIIGSVIGLILIVLKKKKMQSQVPFGPFLIIGTFIALFWGQNIINRYLHFIT